MKLFMVPAAPNPSKVMLYLAEKAALGVHIAVEQVVVNPGKGEQNTPEHLARNPFGSLPVLEVAEGDHLVESLAIIEYLEELHPAPGLWGNDILTRAHARDQERVADQRVLLPIARYVHATNSPIGLPPNPVLAEELAQSLPRALGYFDARFSDGRPFVMGETPCIADCTLAAAFQFMRFGKADLLGAFPHLVTWDAGYRQRAAVADVIHF